MAAHGQARKAQRRESDGRTLARIATPSALTYSVIALDSSAAHTTNEAKK